MRLDQEYENSGSILDIHGSSLPELLDVTPKFCSDIELECEGMSIPTLCKIAQALRLSTDYIFVWHRSVY